MTPGTPHLRVVAAANGSHAPGRVRACGHRGVWRRDQVERVHLVGGGRLVCLQGRDGGEVLWLEQALVRQLNWQLEHPDQAWPRAQRGAAEALAAVMAAQPEEIQIKPRPFRHLGRVDMLLIALVCIAIFVASALAGWFL